MASTDSPHGSSPVDHLFQSWLTHRESHPDADPEAWLSRQPAEHREELCGLIEDYATLTEAVREEAPSFEPGHVIGDFRLMKELGRGGMGSVWEAEQLSLKRRVALKLLKPQFSFSPTFLQRFQREAQAGGRLQHPGIVQTYGVGEAEGIHWIAQELVPDGFTLADSLAEIRKQPAPPEGWYRGVAELFAQVAEALAYAHGHGVIHRDIKPQNLLIGEGNTPKVADFGLAQVKDDLALSRTGDFLGTPFYMSPEQAAAKRMGIDERTDIFSLGATLYEALTLVRAFDGDTSQQVFQKILTEDPLDPRRIRSRVPRDLAVICGKCLEKNPDRRYQGMAELAADLRRHLADEPILARPAGPLLRAWKWVRRHPVLSATSAVGALALGAISVLAASLLLQIGEKNAAYSALAAEKLLSDSRRVEAKQQRDAARWKAYLAGLQAAAVAHQAGNELEALTILGDCAPELRGWEWDFLRSSIDTAISTIGPAEFPAASGVPIPGRDLVAIGEDLPVSGATSPHSAAILLWDVGTGQLEGRLQTHGLYVNALQASPDGRFLMSEVDGALELWDVETHGSHMVIDYEGSSRDAGRHCYPVAGFSANSERLFVYKPDGIIERWNLKERRLELSSRLHPVSDALCYKSLVVAPSGASLVLIGRDDISILATSTLTLRASLAGPAGFAPVAALSAVGDHLLTGHHDGSVILWDLQTAKRLKKVRLDGAIRGLQALPDRLGVMVASDSETALLFFEPDLWKIGLNEGGLNGDAIAVDASGQSVAAVVDNRIYVWTVPSDRPRMVVPALDTIHLSFSDDGQTLRAVSRDGTIRQWAAWAGGNPVTSQEEKGGTPDGMMVDPAGQFVVTTSSRYAAIWDPWSLQPRHMISNPDEESGGLHGWNLSPDGDRIEARQGSSMIRAWNTRTGEEFPPRSVSPEYEDRRDLGLLEDGRSLRWRQEFAMDAGVVRSPILIIEDAETGDEIARLRGHEEQVECASASRDGRLIVSGSRDRTVRIWSLESQQELAICLGSTDWIRDVAIAPDSQRVASTDGAALRIWSAKTGDLLFAAPSPECGHPVVLEFGPMGRRLFAGTFTGRLQVWESRLEDSRRVWHAVANAELLDRSLDPLFDQQLSIDEILGRVRAMHPHDPSWLETTTERIRWRAQLTASRLRWMAHDLLDDYSPRPDARHALSLARSAVAMRPEWSAAYRVLSWALVANGLPSEALNVSERALEMATREAPDRSDEYESQQEELRRAIIDGTRDFVGAHD